VSLAVVPQRCMIPVKRQAVVLQADFLRAPRQVEAVTPAARADFYLQLWARKSAVEAAQPRTRLHRRFGSAISQADELPRGHYAARPVLPVELRLQRPRGDAPRSECGVQDSQSVEARCSPRKVDCRAGRGGCCDACDGTELPRAQCCGVNDQSGLAQVHAIGDDVGGVVAENTETVQLCGGVQASSNQSADAERRREHAQAASGLGRSCAVDPAKYPDLSAAGQARPYLLGGMGLQCLAARNETTLGTDNIGGGAVHGPTVGQALAHRGRSEARLGITSRLVDDTAANLDKLGFWCPAQQQFLEVRRAGHLRKFSRVPRPPAARRVPPA